MWPQIVAVFRPNGAAGCSRGWSGAVHRGPDAEMSGKRMTKRVQNPFFLEADFLIFLKCAAVYFGA